MMKKSDINILIVEDDESLGWALKKAFVQEGYRSTLTIKANDAIREIKVNDYNVILVDCMLPQKNGVDLAVELQSLSEITLHCFLMSGIFKENAFVQEALHKTKAKKFFSKPFDLKEVLNEIKLCFKDQLGDDIPEIYSFLSSPFKDSNLVLNTINTETSLSRLELPYLFALIKQAKLTGELKLTHLNEEDSSVSFYQGHIFQLNNNDTESYFGTLLIENGFTTPEDVTRGLAHRSEKPIGERLVEINSLSPHAIQLAQKEQMSIRLSKIINNKDVSLRFEVHEYEDPEIYLDDSSFINYTHDIITSKIKVDWLKFFFEKWSLHTLHEGPNINQYKEMKNFALVSLTPNIRDLLNEKTTLGELLHNNEQKHFIYHCIYFLLIHECIKISSERESLKNFSASIKRLQKLVDSMKNKNYYQILGVENETPTSKIEQAYHNLSLSLHPDKIPPAAPEELKELSKKAFQFITEAKLNLLDASKRKEYDYQLRHGQTDEILESESFFEAGLLALNNNKYNIACDEFHKVYQLNIFPGNFPIYYAWALIKRGAATSQRKQLINFIDQLFIQTPPEFRHSANYFYVRGLLSKLKGDLNLASMAFKNSFNLDPNFKASHMEWMNIEKIQKQNKRNNSGIFKAVGFLFKK